MSYDKLCPGAGNLPCPDKRSIPPSRKRCFVCSLVKVKLYNVERQRTLTRRSK